MMQQLIYDNITETNLIEKMDGKPVHDFLRCNQSPAEQMIMHSWKEDYKERGIPFVITVDKFPEAKSKFSKQITSMWTIELAPPMVHASKKKQLEPTIFGIEEGVPA